MKKRYIFIILLLMLFILSGCHYDEYEMPEDIYINLGDNVYEIYDKHNSNELIKNTNANIISNDELLINNDIGIYTYTVQYKYKKKKYKYDINYEIVDNTPPVFIASQNTITVEKDKQEDPCSKIVFADNYDNTPTCSIIGKYDVSTLGTYDNLEFIIKDSSNNTITKKFNLNVVEKAPNNNTYTRPNYIYIDEIMNNYKNDNTQIGIDISKWQGTVDFEKVKNAGIEFVIMRMGRQSDSGEEIEMDVRFQEYYKEAKRVGLKVGVYVYNTAISPEDGINTAKWVMKNLNGDKLDFPVAYDWENWKNFMNYKISMHTLSEAYLAFERTLKDSGYDAMLYSSKFYLENVWMHYENSKIWLAHYTSQTDYKGEYMMWQMTSSAKIDGITENTVDIDILYK